MPALTKAARKAVGVPKAVSLDDGTKLKRKLEKSKLDRVLDKEIALPSVNCAPSGVALPAGPGLPAMPSCLPHRKDTTTTEHEESARDQDAPAADEVGRAADRCDAEADEHKKGSAASSFWGRLNGKAGTSPDSLNTGKGNRVVPRSLRDAREDAVCKIESKGITGSGFFVLVQGRLGILTNNHVLPNKKAASIAVAIFQTARMGTVEVALYPHKLWHSSPKDELDYSLVACEVPQGIQPMDLLPAALPEVQQGDTIVIVQHPDGGEKSASSGPVHKVHPPYITYEADTEAGSSGSPVFKDYHPIALHHCAPRADVTPAAGLLGSFTCVGQRVKHTNKGVILRSILVDLQQQMKAKGKGAGSPTSDGAAGDGNTKSDAAYDPADTSKLAVLQRLRAGAASCLARRKVDVGVEECEGKASDDGWGAKVSNAMAACGVARQDAKSAEKATEKEVKKKKLSAKGQRKAAGGQRADMAQAGAAADVSTDGERSSVSCQVVADEVAQGDDENDEEEMEEEESEDREDQDFESEDGEEAAENKNNQSASWSSRVSVVTLPSAASVLSWYKGRPSPSTPVPTSFEEDREKEQAEAEEQEGDRTSKSWREGCSIGGFDGKTGKKDRSAGKQDKSLRTCGVTSSAGLGGISQFSMPALFGGSAAGAASGTEFKEGKTAEKHGRTLRKRPIEQSEETRMIRAGVAGHGIVAAHSRDEEIDDEHEERDASGEDEVGEVPMTRRAMRITSKAMDGSQCGVGLVLESWKPRGLAHALNLVARTTEAVRVDQVVPDGPADHAVPRLEKGDIVKEIDGVSVTGLAHAKELVLGAPGTMVSLKMVRNQYPFDVSMRRGLRGGAHSFPPADDEPTMTGQHNETNGFEGPMAKNVPSGRKFVQGIPSFYSRQKKEEVTLEATPPPLSSGESQSTAARLLQLAHDRAQIQEVPASVLASVPEEQLLQQEDALQARLRALGFSSFSGDSMGGKEEEEEEASLPPREAPMHPLTRFNQAYAHKHIVGYACSQVCLARKNRLTRLKQATAPRMRGVLAAPGASDKTLGQELLDKACVGDVAAIKHLVAVGADTNFVDTEPGWSGVTPIMNAATNGHRSAVMTLLVLGAKLDVKDEHGWSVLHRAAGKGHKAVVQALVNAGADLTARDKSGLSAKDWARFCGHEGLVDLLTPSEDSEEELRAQLDRLKVPVTHTLRVCSCASSVRFPLPCSHPSPLDVRGQMCVCVCVCVWVKEKQKQKDERQGEGR